MTMALALMAVACAVTGTADFDPPDGVSADAVLANKEDGGDAAASTTRGDLPCDVDAVLKKHCQQCHGSEPTFGASLSLVTHADLMKLAPGDASAKKVFDLVKERIHDDAKPMPPSPNPRLPANALTVFDAWINAGTKPSTETCDATGHDVNIKPLSCTPDTTLKASKPYTLKANSPLDQTMCFGVSVPRAKKRHVTALAPTLDKKEVIRNILLFQTDKPVPSEPFPCSEVGSTSWQLVAGWAPGGNNLEFPPEAGLPEAPGTTHWVVQIRYGNTGASEIIDQSGYELCTTELLRPNDAGILAFGTTNFMIPPRATHTLACDYRLERRFKNVVFVSASPHLQSLATSVTMQRLVGGSGSPEMLLEQREFRAEAQLSYRISKPVAQNDVIRTTCAWKNTTDTQVGFGESQGAETCFNFVAYYPKIIEQVVGKGRLPALPFDAPVKQASCTAL